MSDAAAEHLKDAVTATVRSALLLLLGAVGFPLIVAYANVANLVMAQTAKGERQLAIRAAIGAERPRLIWQFLMESVVLSAISGVIGVLAAQWGVDALVALAPTNSPRLDSVSLNFPVLLFAMALCRFLAASLGVFAAVRATSSDLREALGETGREQAGGQHSQRFGRMIVAGQLAITLILLVGAGLLGRSLRRVLSVDPGFRTEQVISIDLAFALHVDTDTEKALHVSRLNELFEHLRAIPGIEVVGGASDLPLASEFVGNGTFLVLSPGQLPTRMEDFERLMHNVSFTGNADYSAASEAYF
jgi:putative ABC transport system permease protein